MRHTGREYDVAVVGLGPSGLATALALAHVGAEVVAVGAAPASSEARAPETRTAALLTSSVDLLKALGVWQALEPQAAPLRAVRIIDASTSLIRAPDIEFAASELGLPALGYNIANTRLAEALFARAQDVLPEVVVGSVSQAVIAEDKVVLKLSDGAPLSARLVAGADGRNSICRKAAGIGASERRYDQAALASSFSHARPHDGVSTELHREDGSVTTVPLPEPNSSALIWLEKPGEIARLMRLDAERFADTLSRRLEGLLGPISNIGPRAEFPVAGLVADSLAAKRITLVGEAAHILPPIGAQGLNLGLRDAASLADCVAAALRARRDPGGEDVLEAYRQSRRLDVMSRAYGVDLLSRSLLTSLPPLQAARGLVLHGLKALPPLRRAVMRVGLEPPTALPSLMRPLA
ncbi:MAG TPA: FAD-dependent monooxygenase [Methyloceanibacter sp.]|nr:FAD-dependent monooxygenase [Methyloceanibacter sp.]